MASITRVSGKHNAALSSPNSKWVIMADEVNLFEVADWIPQPSKDPKTGVLTPVKPDDIETPAKVTWKIKDTSGKNVINTFSGNVLDKAKMKINKKYSGSYGYVLEATNDVSKATASTYVLGHCESKIVTAQWSKSESASVQDEINYGQSIYVTLDTEGLNGDKLTFELYNKKDDKKVLGTVTGDCINGDITVKMPTIGGLKPPGTAKELAELEDFIIKVKNPVGVYIKKGSDEKVVTFKIKNKTAPEEPVAPSNITPLKVGEPDKAPESIGILSLEKIAVKTTYDVCNDEVGKFDDFKNFWILENGGKYYHWLKKSLIGLKEADDKKKPTPIPITLASADNFTFKATFKTILPLDGVGIRVRDRDNKYIFTTMPHPKQAKDALHEIEFKSTNTPYKDTVQYFSNFELIFDYSLDKKSWTPMGSAQFCFYLTWKEPKWSIFQDAADENGTMKIKCTKSGKKNILETVLWIGCSGAKGKGKNEEEILDAMFKVFETLKVTRAREGKGFLSKDWSSLGLGYWRDQSSIIGPGIAAARTIAGGNALRYLISYGEARCGEWDVFFQHVALTQNITTKSFVIFSGTGNPGVPTITPITSELFLVKSTSGWNLRDPKAAIEKPPVGNKAQGNLAPLHQFQDHVFTIYRNSSSQMKFYDASYGVKSSVFFKDELSLLSAYSKGLEGVVYISPFVGLPADKPQHYFIFDLHYKKEVYITGAHNYKTETKNMQNHLVVYLP